MNEKEISEELLSEISEAIIRRKKIAAIKIYREATGCGLKEAKEAIEEITSSLVSDNPKLLAKKSSGCASLIIFGFLVTYVVYRFGVNYLV